MSEQFILCQDDLGNYEIRYDDKVFHFLWEVAPILNEQQATIKQLESDKAIAEDYANIFEKENVKLRKKLNTLAEENERLKNKLNVTALELVDEAISMGKAVEISEMSYREFIDYRAENGKPMELQL